MDYYKVIKIDQLKCSFICSHCGTSNLINNKNGYVICKWCGHKVTIKDKNSFDKYFYELIKRSYKRFITRKGLK